jgi:hypothetical protein
VEDSNYRVYDPSWNNDALEIKIDHIRGGATAGNDGYTIPKIVMEVVDTSAEILGAVGALETLGISKEAANGAVAAFDGFCKLFNTLSPWLVGRSDDGGRFYTLAVVCHAVNRACSSVSVE